MSKSSNKAKLELIDDWIRTKEKKNKTKRKKISRINNYKKDNIR